MRREHRHLSVVTEGDRPAPPADRSGEGAASPAAAATEATSPDPVAEERAEGPRAVPRCNAPVLQGRDPHACQARSYYVVLMADGPIFACKRHLSVAVDGRHRESHRHQGPGEMAVVWSAVEWSHAGLRADVAHHGADPGVEPVSE